MARDEAIPALRRRIDRIDDQLLRLLNRRATLNRRIGAAKARTQAPVYDPARERELVGRLVAASPGPLDASHVRAIWREILSASRSLQAPLRVAYFGPAATWAHLAAQAHFGSAAAYQPAPTVADVFADVEHGRADVGVVPVENSTEGMVAQTLDLLLTSPLSIRHCLLARNGTTPATLARVVAHPQALAQCRRWLATHLPGVAVGEETSNARAAERAAGERATGAIASAVAAETYGLAVLARDIQDETRNVTRFLVLAHTDCAEPSGDDKTSLLFSVRDEVGILVRMLQPFAAHRIDLIKIESRPLRERPWEYYFFLDLKGHRREPRVRRALAETERRALRLKVLGSYPAAPEVS